MHVLASLAVLAKHAAAGGELFVVRDVSTCIAGGSEILGRVKAESSSAAHAAGTMPIALGPMGLARVLDKLDTGTSRDFRQTHHVGHLPVKVHGQDEASSLRNRSFDRGDGDV